MLCCLPPGEELEGHTVPGFSWLTVALPPWAWVRYRTLSGVGNRSLQRYTAVQLTGPELARVEQQVRITHGLLTTRRDDPQAIAHAQHQAAALTAQIATAVCEGAGGLTAPRMSVRNRARLARRAAMWMREHLGQSIQVPDLCLALHVSRRELEFAFRTTFDQSPRDYLQALRLHAIHRALRHGRASVTRAAFDHGITHLGRLAAHYRSLFGESPNETLTRGAAVRFRADA
jgi:AraC-like DNA-binding protein